MMPQKQSEEYIFKRREQSAVLYAENRSKKLKTEK